MLFSRIYVYIHMHRYTSESAARNYIQCKPVCEDRDGGSAASRCVWIHSAGVQGSVVRARKVRENLQYKAKRICEKLGWRESGATDARDSARDYDSIRQIREHGESRAAADKSRDTEAQRQRDTERPGTARAERGTRRSTAEAAKRATERETETQSRTRPRARQRIGAQRADPPIAGRDRCRCEPRGLPGDASGPGGHVREG